MIAALGDEMPLDQGQVNIGEFLKALRKVGYQGPLCIERGVGNQWETMADVAAGIKVVRRCLEG